MTTLTSPASLTLAPPRRRIGSWIALLVAAVFEIGYALSVNGSEAFTDLPWSIAAAVFFLLTLFFLSFALRGLDVGMGYAVWTGLGAVGAALFAPLFFDETLTWTKAFWLAVVIGGVVWLKLADRPTRAAAHAASVERSGDPV